MESRPLVNGALMIQNVGQTVSLFGTVISVDPSGNSFDLMSTDRHVITVALRTPLSEPLSGVVEVHGIVKGKNNIIANYFMAVPTEIAANFDPEVANDVVTLVHNVPNAWLST